MEGHYQSLSSNFIWIVVEKPVPLQPKFFQYILQTRFLSHWCREFSVSTGLGTR